ncbi:sensor histidine kinase [Halovenus salina]|nr:ATP-binding protein [Halovenus salina]
MPEHYQATDARILHVDDDPGQLNVVETYFERELPEVEMVTATDAKTGLETLASTQIDCIISDYDMPEVNGLEFLEHVRATHSDVPFILYTGKGSEEIASKAINSGVTGYLQKGGPEQLQRLIHRVEHAAEEHRAKVESERYATVLRALNYPIYVVDDEGTFEYVNDAFVEMVGYDRGEILGSPPGLIKTEEGVERANETLRRIVSSSGPDRKQFRVDIHTKGGDTIPCRDHMATLPFDDEFRGSVGILQDISQQEQRREQLATQNERLEEIISFVSHDLRTPLAQARAGVDLAHDSGGDEDFERVESALDRIEDMISELRTLARTGIVVDCTTTVDIGAIATRAWETFSTPGDTLEYEAFEIEGDPERIKPLVENLLRNAIEHTADGVTVTVEPCEDGFYVADDGEGISEEKREQVFEPGYTTARDGSGFGLAIVRRVSQAHGWELTVTESEAGGARFEFRNVAVDTDCAGTAVSAAD